MRTLSHVPADLFAQASGVECDCLCPLPQQEKLNAEDCASLAKASAEDEAYHEDAAAANTEAMAALARYRDLVRLAHAAAGQAGAPLVAFPDV